MLLLHGLLGYSFSWRFNLGDLGKLRTLYALDQLGAGFSDRPSEIDCTMAGIAGRVLEFADTLGLDQFDLLGTSHGGAIAIMVAGMLAAQERARINNLILVAPANPWSPHGKLVVPFLNQQVVSRLFLRLFPSLSIAHWLVLRRLYGDRSRIRPGTLRGYAAPLSVPGSLEYGLKILKSWLDDLENLKMTLPQLRNIRTLILWGSADVAVNPDSAGMIRKEIPNSEFLCFPGVGHLPYEEVPEKFNRAVSDFLTGQHSV